jgi:2,4-dienoyl-CoA reductase-like NADH-dependent reductase (Old Yellow Enzyme family)
LDPISVRGLKLKNRLVMPPMGTDLSNPSGFVTEKHLAYYGPRSREVGLVIVEHTYVDVSGRYTLTQLGIHNDETIHGLKKLVEVIHGSGAAAAIQINHSGGKCSSSICGCQPVGPSSIHYFKEPTRGLEVEEIRKLVKAFGDAALRAVKAGFDAVEIHAAHGWLLNQFASPITNKRTDQYGGSLRNRFRFPLEVIEEVRRRVGSDYPLLFRLGADDFIPGGLTIEESKAIAPELVKAGVDVLDISGGLCGIYHPTSQNPGFFIPIAEDIKKVVSVPVIGVGGIRNARFADELIKSGRVDLVAVGRALMKEEDWGVREVSLLRRKIQ